MLTISLIGPLQVSDAEGRDWTPKSAKARGLLAILAVSRDLRRSRTWLRKRLWSASAAAQASDSLRQCLTEIRKAMGPHADILITDRASVSLDPSQITVAYPDPDGASGGDICDELYVPDPVFHDWLQGFRNRHREKSAGPLLPMAQNTGAPDRVAVVISMAHPVSQHTAWMYQMLRESITLLLRESGDIDVVTENEPVPHLRGPDSRYYFIVIEVSELGEQAVISTRLEGGPSGSTLWNSGQKRLRNIGSDETIWELNTLAFRTHEVSTSAIVAEVGEKSGTSNAFALAIRGRNRLFEFSRDSLIDADRLLSAAYELEPRGSFLAWRHFVRNTAAFEHLSDSFLKPVNRVDMIEQAVIDSSANPFVLAVASQDAFVRKGDLQLAQALVQESLEQNEVNPLGWGFQSNIHILNGEYDKAIAAAGHTQKLVSSQSYRGFFLMFPVMSQMATGNYEMAAFHANMSHYLMPRLVAAQRFLYALNEAMGRESQALTVMRKIRKREPEFSKQHFFRANYPVATMRKMEIMDLLA